MKRDGYDNHQIAGTVGVSECTVRRLLRVDPACLCVDGTQTRKSRSTMDPYRKEVHELLDKGFKPSQILRKLQTMHPDRIFKRTTVNDLCCDIREESTGHRSMAAPYKYAGQAANGTQFQSRNGVHKVKRRDLASVIWSGSDKVPAWDIVYIEQHFPAYTEILSIITEFRSAYAEKNIESISTWIVKNTECRFPSIRSFIKGMRADEDAFFNSIKFQYNNGLLEGCVNKLKTIKRSMFGRARYALLRAKMLLAYH